MAAAAARQLLQLGSVDSSELTNSYLQLEPANMLKWLVTGSHGDQPAAKANDVKLSWPTSCGSCRGALEIAKIYTVPHLLMDRLIAQSRTHMAMCLCQLV